MQSLKEQNSKSSISSDFVSFLSAVIHILDLKLVKRVINEAFQISKETLRNSTRFDLLVRNTEDCEEQSHVSSSIRPWLFCNDLQQSNVLELSRYCTWTAKIHNHIRRI